MEQDEESIHQEDRLPASRYFGARRESRAQLGPQDELFLLHHLDYLRDRVYLLESLARGRAIHPDLLGDLGADLMADFAAMRFFGGSWGIKRLRIGFERFYEFTLTNSRLRLLARAPNVVIDCINDLAEYNYMPFWTEARQGGWRWQQRENLREHCKCVLREWKRCVEISQPFPDRQAVRQIRALCRDRAAANELLSVFPNP